MFRVRSLVRAASGLFGGTVLLALVLIVSPSAGGGLRVTTPGGNEGNPRVFPPGSNPYGASYADWSVRWWQWAYGLPVAGHPLFDETGSDCGAGQSGPVWYLGGVFNVSGTANRTLCSVPAGKALFFPIINAEWDNFCPPNEPPLTVDELRTTVASLIDLVTDLSCELDGRPIGNLESYRFDAGPFGVDQPSGNIWQAFGCDTPAGHYEPLLADGFFLMLTPLSPGPHQLHFRGTIGDPINFTLDITYDLTVVPDHDALVETPLESGLQGSGLAGMSQGPGTPTTWGRMKVTYR